MGEGSHLEGYRCLVCGSEFPPEPARTLCPDCGGNLDVEYAYAAVEAHWSKDVLVRTPDRSIWRYLPLLPVEAPPVERSLCVGGTPLVSLPRLAAELSLRQIWAKDDTRNPSGSLKDRASEVGLRHALEQGAEVIVAASTGNAAASLAALAAYHRARALILAPASAPPAKLTQILQHGALLCTVQGSYDQAFDLSMKVADEYGWYTRSTGVNPVLSEGKKTVALEIAEQLGWEVPDVVFVPVGDGCIIGGVYRGFSDLLRLSWIDRIPKIVAVQAKGSSAIVDALRHDRDIQPVQADTVADSISVDMPRDGLKALRAVRESGGFGMIVTDDEILNAQKSFSARTGIFAEPAAAATFAGLLRAVEEGKIDSGESVALLITGSGLKDIAAAQRRIEIPDPLEPELAAFGAFVERHKRQLGR